MVELTFNPEYKYSRWIAANNPIYFQLTRKDAAIVNIAEYIGSGAGTLEITLDGTYSELAVGQYIYVNSGIYDNQLLIEEVSGAVVICSGKIYKGETTGGYCNFTTARTNYKVDVDLVNSDEESLLTEYISYTPSGKGIISLDFSSLLRSYLTNEIDIDYTIINKVLTNLSYQFNFKYREYYAEQGAGTWSDLLGSNFIAVNGAMQIGDASGQNMQPYVMFPNLEYTTPLEYLVDMGGTGISDDDESLIQLNEQYTKGKFLTMFEQPIYNIGYPFSLSFLPDVLLNGFVNYICRGERKKDLNGVILEEVRTELNTTFGDINQLTLPDVYASNINRVDIMLTNSDQLNTFDTILKDYLLNVEELQDLIIANNQLYIFKGYVREGYSKLYQIVEYIPSGTCPQGQAKSGIAYDEYTYDLVKTSSNVDLINCQEEVYGFQFYVKNLTGEDFYIYANIGGGGGIYNGANFIELSFNGYLINKNIVWLDKDVNGNNQGLYSIYGSSLNEAILIKNLDVTQSLVKTYTGDTLNNYNALILPDEIDDSIIKVFFFAVGDNGRILRGESDTYYDKLENTAYAYAINNAADITHGLTTENLRRIQFLNLNEGYIFGDNFTILKTLDGGETWAKIENIQGGYNASLYEATCYDGAFIDDKVYYKLKNIETGQYDVMELTSIIASNEILSEVKTINIDNECHDNAIYLRWLNPLGGVDYWLFDYRNSHSYNVSNEKVLTKDIKNMQLERGRQVVLSKRSSEEIELFAENLTFAQIEGLKYLMSSPTVEMLNGYYVDGSPLWLTVRIPEGAFFIKDTYENKAEVSFTIIKSEKYLQL